MSKNYFHSLGEAIAPITLLDPPLGPDLKDLPDGRILMMMIRSADGLCLHNQLGRIHARMSSIKIYAPTLWKKILLEINKKDVAESRIQMMIIRTADDL